MSNERSGLLRSGSRSWSRPSFLRFFNATAAKMGALALVGALVFGAFAHEAEAKRMGGSRSMGRQSNMVSQQQSAAPSRAPQQAATPPAAAAPGMAQPARNRWMGPLAGIAAGLGIGALLSHFGMGGALAGGIANMLMIAAVVFIGIWLVRKFMRRRDADTPAYAAAGSGNAAPGYEQTRFSAPPTGGFPAQAPLQTPPIGAGQAGAFGAGAAAGGATAAHEPWGVPADFDRESFLHNSKVYFVRMQAAWDSADLDDIRDFTTPEMFAEIRLDLSARGAVENRTDVVQVDAELLGIEEKDGDYVASVRFSGMLREDKNAPAQAFAEVWNLAKRKQGGEGWLLAGIQQLN